MTRLGNSFGFVADDYDRGRPRYPDEAVTAMLEGLPAAPEVVEVGAGTGQLTGALAEAGARVTAVEPAPDTRALLERRVAGRARVLDATAEKLPLQDASADMVVCADSFHWFDADRAVAEFRRVLRRGARLCLSGLLPQWTPEESAGWADETGAIIRPLWERAKHPLLAGGFRVPDLPDHSGFEQVAAIDLPFVFETDRDGLLALFGSWSALASLPEDERSEIRAQLTAVLERHGVADLELTYAAKLRFHVLRV